MIQVFLTDTVDSVRGLNSARNDDDDDDDDDDDSIAIIVVAVCHHYYDYNHHHLFITVLVNFLIMVFIATVTNVIMVIMVRISCAKKAGNGKDNKWREIEKSDSRNGKRNEKGRTTERRGESKDKPGKQWITKRLSNQETASKNVCKLSNSQDPTKGNGNRRCRGGMVWLGTIGRIGTIGMIEFRIPGIRVLVFLSQVDLQAVAQVAEQNLEASRSTQNL